MIDRWSNEIDIITNEFIRSFGHLNSQQLNIKPDPDTWSIGQVIIHLIITNESYFPIIKDLKNGSYKVPLIGKLSFIYNSLGNLILKSVQPDRKRSIKTFKLWEPSDSEVHSDIVSKFEKHQSELKNTIKECETLLTNNAVISSLANKNIVYKLETAFDIIVAHERRHFLQAKEIIPYLNKMSIQEY